MLRNFQKCLRGAAWGAPPGPDSDDLTLRLGRRKRTVFRLTSVTSFRFHRGNQRKPPDRHEQAGNILAPLPVWNIEHIVYDFPARSFAPVLSLHMAAHQPGNCLSAGGKPISGKKTSSNFNFASTGSKECSTDSGARRHWPNTGRENTHWLFSKSTLS